MPGTQSVNSTSHAEGFGQQAKLQILQGLLRSGEGYVDKQAAVRTHMDLCFSWFSSVKDASQPNLKIKELRPYQRENLDGLCVESKDRRKLKVVCIRNKFIEACPLVALAMYLFAKFHMEYDVESLTLQEQIVFIQALMESPIGHGSNTRLTADDGFMLKQENFYIKEEESNSYDTKCIEINSDEQQRLSGFELGERYIVKRGQIDTLPELNDKIFPVLRCPEFAASEEGSLLKLLRRVLCQDMAILRRSYPTHPLSAHPTFTDNSFNNFAKEMELIGLIDVCGQSYEHDTSTTIQHTKLRKELNTAREELQRASFERDNNLCVIERLALNYSSFTKRERSFLESVEECGKFLSSVQYSMYKNGTMSLPPINNETVGLIQMSRDYNFMMDQAITNLKNMVRAQKKYYNRINSERNAILADTISKNLETRREKILGRKLSRKASNVFEMWDDFKSLEKSLKDNGISISEWLKLHGSSERQFRHTRLKIIRFVESEAEKTNTTIDAVKQKLHQKMKNRQKPWTLDEVQRKLTAGKRIDLSYNQ